ncbi:MAG: terminase family protein, partial [Deltaproteobacteria bacterium]
MTEAKVLSFSRMHPAQKEMRDNAKRFNVCCLGRRTGKTYFGLDTLIVDSRGALEGFPVAWFAPSYKYLDEVFRNAKSMLWPVKQRIDAQQHRIELIGGGSIDFWSMDDDDPARGRKYSIVIIDEADMTRRLIDKWQRAIRPTLIDYRGSAWFFSTPRGIQDFHKLFQKGVVGSDSYDADWISWQMPSTVNPFLDPAEIEAARLELPQLVFNQEILAQFVDFGGTVVYRD